MLTLPARTAAADPVFPIRRRNTLVKCDQICRNGTFTLNQRILCLIERAVGVLALPLLFNNSLNRLEPRPRYLKFFLIFETFIAKGRNRSWYKPFSKIALRWLDIRAGHKIRSSPSRGHFNSFVNLPVFGYRTVKPFTLYSNNHRNQRSFLFPIQLWTCPIWNQFYEHGKSTTPPFCLKFHAWF